MSHRIEKINKLIWKSISEIIARELDLKSGVFITVSKIDTTPDLRYTRVFVSVFPEKETNYVLSALKNGVYAMQGYLNKKLAMKPVPKIEFRIDTTEAKADEIEKLLKEI